jgi:cell division septal protein FtsQ
MPPGLRSLPPRLWRLPLRRKLALATVFAVVGMCGWLVLRDSALFAVNDVTIVGLSADAVPAVSEALDAAARSQTTTDFSTGDVRAAVATFSLITGIRASTHLSHGVTLFVSEELPVARIEVRGTGIPVAADGRVITGFSPQVHLATVRSGRVPLGGRTHDRFVLSALRVLSAAPAPLFARVAAVTHANGALTIYLHHGPRLIFGDGALPHAKWDAAAAVLAARSSRGASYIDLVLPWRPSAQVADPGTALSAATAVGAPAAATTALSAGVLQASG